MLSHEQVELVAGQGITGDRYALKTGSYSSLRASVREPGAREPGRQLTIISADSVDAALAAAGLTAATAPGKSYSDFRRNVVLRGISAAELFAAQGTELCLGPVCRVFVHRHCVPCMYNERLCERPGQLEAIFDASGVSCEVLVGGKLGVGDSVRPAPKSSPGQSTVRDLGKQPPGYFVRPSRRTKAMGKAAHAHMARALDDLLTTDPVGADRAEAAYNSVGLGFWPASVRAAWRLRTRRRIFVAASLGCVMLVAATLWYSGWLSSPPPVQAEASWWPSPFSSEWIAQAEAERQAEALRGQQLQLGLAGLVAAVLFVAVRFWREQLDILRSLVRL